MLAVEENNTTWFDWSQPTISWCISQEILESQADSKALTSTKNFFLSCDSAVQPPNSLF